MPIITLEQQIAAANESAVKVTQGIDLPVGTSVLLGYVEEGFWTYAIKHSADSTPFIWFATDCCLAAASCDEFGTYCKNCYKYVHTSYGDIYSEQSYGPITKPSPADLAEVAKVEKRVAARRKREEAKRAAQKENTNV